MSGDRDKFFELGILQEVEIEQIIEVMPPELKKKVKKALSDEKKILNLLEDKAINYDEWSKELNDIVKSDFPWIEDSMPNRVNSSIRSWLIKLISGNDVGSPEYQESFENLQQARELYSKSIRELNTQMEEALAGNDKKKIKELTIKYLVFYDLKKELYKGKNSTGVGKALNEKILQLENELREKYGDDYDSFAKKWEVRNDNGTWEVILPITGGVLIVGVLHFTAIKPVAKFVGKSSQTIYNRRAFLKKVLRWKE